jgi:hypothetical protein
MAALTRRSEAKDGQVIDPSFSKTGSQNSWQAFVCAVRGPRKEG